MSRVVAIIAAFAPSPTQFARVIEATLAQTSSILVVDNGEGRGLESVRWSSRVERLDLHGNAGVAAAHNAGARHAFRCGATHILLLDHDSIPKPGMLDALLRAWRELSGQGEQVASVGANYKDPRRPEVSPYVRVDGWQFRRVSNRDATARPFVSYVISSGCLISAHAFQTIGPMDERFFIDYVDIEWGLRAANMGWKTFGVCAAELEHALGDAPLHILGRSYPLRSPERHFYMVRNGVHLVVRGDLPVSWRFVEAYRLLRWVLAYATLPPNRSKHIASMWQGLVAGIKGRLGVRDPVAQVAGAPAATAVPKKGFTNT